LTAASAYTQILFGHGLYLQAMNDGHVMRKRVAKYLIPVFLLSFGFNIPKFFEAQVNYKDMNYLDYDYITDNSTSYSSSTMISDDYEEDNLANYNATEVINSNLYTRWLLRVYMEKFKKKIQKKI
jgi:hypothetical protein